MATASNIVNQDSEVDAELRDNFNEDMLAMLSQGSSNDVRIILSDGEITANRDVLAARSEYFAAQFRWKEETKDDSDSTEITDCCKEVMERIIKYLFTGSIKFKDLGLMQLLELVNQVRKLLLKGDLQGLIEKVIREEVISFVKHKHSKSETLLNLNCTDIIRGFQYADKFAIDGVRPLIFRSFVALLPWIISRDDGAIAAFSSLPSQIVMELFSHAQHMTIPKRNQRGLYSALVRCFLAWYQQNEDMCPNEKKKIFGMIDLDLVNASDLFQVVKPSGLFPDVEVDKRIIERLRERDEMKGE